MNEITIRPAGEHEVPVILGFIRDLAAYEHLEHEVVATEEHLREVLFGARRYAEVVFACLNGEPVGFALFFHNFSTFLGKPGIYLEDLFVLPGHRGTGLGKALLRSLATLAVHRGYARVEWSVLDWNELAIGFYRRLGADVLPDWRICRVAGDAIGRLAEM